MLVVHKYTLRFDDSDCANAYIPQGGKILDCQLQHGDVVLWAWVDTERPEVPRSFKMFPTGLATHDGPSAGWRWQHVATIQFEVRDGHAGYVGHIFEGVK